MKCSCGQRTCDKVCSTAPPEAAGRDYWSMSHARKDPRNAPKVKTEKRGKR